MPGPKPDIIILKKNADRHASTMPDEGESALYKRCGFKKPDGFRVHCTWVLPCEDSTIFVKVFLKREGRAGSENKSELPPPVDTTLFFGNIAIVAFMGATVETAQPTPLSVQRLDSLFELLVGGTEDLGGAAADKADAAEDLMAGDDDVDALLPRTQEGYAKDGFVVDDDEDSNAVDSGDDDDDSSEGHELDSEDDEAASENDDMHEDLVEDQHADAIMFESGHGKTELHPEEYDSE